jgi:hypothetical protein
MPRTLPTLKPNRTPTSGRLQRLVKSLCCILLGEQNTKCLYGDDNASKQLEAYARERGMTVICCKNHARHEAIVNWMIDPLAYAEQKEAEEKKECMTLEAAIGANSQRADHASATENGEGVPPMLKFKPGERITHIAVRDLTTIRRNEVSSISAFTRQCSG